MSNQEAIKLERVSKTYPARPPVTALRAVTLAISPGCFCVVEGPSGSGKTTLLGIVAGLEIPTSGRVRVSGQEVTGVNGSAARTRQEIGLIFQDFKLISALTVAENVAGSLGGGIHVVRNDLTTLTSCILWNNHINIHLR